MLGKSEGAFHAEGPVRLVQRKKWLGLGLSDCYGEGLGSVICYCFVMEAAKFLARVGGCRHLPNF